MIPRRYRKRPGEIEAVRYTGTNLAAIEVFVGRDGKVTRTVLPGFGRGLTRGVKIHTLEGDVTARIGDYVIRDGRGQFDSCPGDTFHETYEPYEPVEETQ